MKVLNLFPSSIIQDKILINQEVKQGMIKEIETMVSDSKNKDDKGTQDLSLIHISEPTRPETIS